MDPHFRTGFEKKALLGMGVARQVMPKIFKKMFYTGGKISGQKVLGTGLTAGFVGLDAADIVANTKAMISRTPRSLIPQNWYK